MDAQIGNNLGVSAKGITSGISNLNGGTGPQAGLAIANCDTVLAMRTRLAAISGTTYTAAVLNTMSFNDMKYAIRLNDNPTTI